MQPNDPTELQRIDSRLERIEEKLDTHLERVAHVERDVEWLKGSLKISGTIFLTIVGFMASALYKLLFPHQ